MRRAWVWVGQAVLAAAVVWFLAERMAGQWGKLTGVPASLVVSVGPILIAAIAVLAAYALLIAAWRTVLHGWGAHLPFPRAARIWCLSNLGRYIPGKVWSVAGLAVLAQREGAQGWAAAGSAVAMQALALGTGSIVVAVALPGSPTIPAVLIAGVLAILLVAGLTSPRAAGLVGRVTRGRFTMNPLPVRAVALGGLATITAWVLYGFALHQLSAGILASDPPPFVTAVGVFAGGYIVGLIAIFAPGGLGVRELVLVGLLEPVMGAAPALALSVASRLLLTATELAAALVALGIGPRPDAAGSATAGRDDT